MGGGEELHKKIAFRPEKAGCDFLNSFVELPVIL